MVDIHIHTTYSDGDKTIAEVLRMCEEKNLEYISITDHNTCKQYEDEILKNNNIFSGRIIKGAELNAVFKNKTIEVLAYNIKNHSIIDEWCQKYYSEEKLKEQRKISLDRLLDICAKLNLIYDENKIRKIEKEFVYISIPIYNELMAHEENYKILGQLTESFGTFYRKGLANPESVFFDNNIESKPKYKEVIDIIHKAGGKAFLAHPFEYKFEDTIGFINDLRKETELDGIECFHPSADENEMDILVKYARNNNLYISGGSDYHGTRKPDIELGVGAGNLNISKEIIEEWVNK